ncbi:hypothetical protein T439DRAFT_352362 [Meredithblackwellia eburnea MCA 4105]
MAGVEMFDDTVSTISYSGNWSTRNDLVNVGWFNNAFHVCTAETLTADCSATISFTGTNITLGGNLIPNRGKYYCYVDGQLPWKWYDNAVTTEVKGELCGVSNLTNGDHTLTFGAMTIPGIRSANGNINGITLDLYNVTASPAGQTAVWRQVFFLFASTLFFSPPMGYANSTKIPTSAAPGTSTGKSASPTKALPPNTSSTGAVSSSDGETEGGSSTPVGAIAGGVVGGVCLLGIVVAAFWVFRKRLAKNRSENGESRKAFSEYGDHTSLPMPPDGYVAGGDPLPAWVNSPNPELMLPLPRRRSFDGQSVGADSYLGGSGSRPMTEISFSGKTVSSRNGLADPADFRSR